MAVGRVVRSAFTWRQLAPPTANATRAAVLDHVVARVLALGTRRLRVAIDGRTASGKTTFADELADCLARRGHVVLRASLDDFKRPWAERGQYDRLSGEGYYRNAFDVDAMCRLLLDPAARAGSGRVVLCSIDPRTQISHADEVTDMPHEAVLVVDGVFAFRAPLDDAWDLRVWLDVDRDCSLRRGVARDGDAAVHRVRYEASEELYLAEVDPMSRADVVVDNRDLDRPAVLRP